MNSRAVVQVVLSIVLVSSVLAGTGVGMAADSTTNKNLATSSDAPDTAVVVERIENTSNAQFTVTIQMDNVEKYQMAVSRHGNVVSTSGAKNISDEYDFPGKVYEWDGESDEMQIVMQKPSMKKEGDFLATDEWWFGKTPHVRGYWYMEGDTESSTKLLLGSTTRTNGSDTGDVSTENEHAVVGGYYTAIGALSTTTVEVPESKTTLEFVSVGETSFESKEEFARQVGESQPYLKGTHPRTAQFFVMPSDAVPLKGETAPSARQAWVSEDAEISNPANLWLHEYIHIQQDGFILKGDMLWLREAVTTYQTAVLSAQIGDADPDKAYYQVSRDGHEDVVLADYETWKGTTAPYVKGSRVVFALDSRIRDASDGEYSLLDVMEQVQSEEEHIRYNMFREWVVNVSDEETGVWMDSVVKERTQADVPAELLAFPENGSAGVVYENTPTPTPASTETPTPTDTATEIQTVEEPDPQVERDTSILGVNREKFLVGVVGVGTTAVVLVGVYTIISIRRREN